MTTEQIQAGYAPVNGLHMYYEIIGSGQPLILIHGGVGTTDMFGANRHLLAQGRKVIAVDLQAHGRTADIDRPMAFEAMADDIAALIAHLDLGPVQIMGFSLGGGVGLQTAIRHPGLVEKLVVVSFPCRFGGWFPEVAQGFAGLNAAAAEAMKPSPIYQTYAAVAPHPEHFPQLVEKLGAFLRQDYDWSAEVSQLQIPVMLVAGDADSIAPSHIAEFYGLLGGGQHDPGWDGSAGRSSAQLAVLPRKTHYDIHTAPELAAAVIPFLD